MSGAGSDGVVAGSSEGTEDRAISRKRSMDGSSSDTPEDSAVKRQACGEGLSVSTFLGASLRVKKFGGDHAIVRMSVNLVSRCVDLNDRCYGVAEIVYKFVEAEAHDLFRVRVGF